MTLIGPAGWAYKDWNGVVYPSPKPRGFQPLTFLARYFDVIEINVSFYLPLTPAMAQQWLEQVREHKNFRFTAKIWRGFTHHRNTRQQDEDEFKTGLAPLAGKGRLGALLLQFPWSFRNTAENLDYVAHLSQRFGEFPIVLEVRHSSWSALGILDTLAELGIGLCNIDQPQFKCSTQPSALTTSPVGYIRLHGRNYQSWFTENKYAGERYDYLYSADELDPWLDRVKAVAQAAEETYVVTNNHYLGKAIVNALEITSVLKGKPVEAPETLTARYPELRDFTTAPDSPSQLSLPTE